jgi:hypothetical protein
MLGLRVEIVCWQSELLLLRGGKTGGLPNVRHVRVTYIVTLE